MNTLNKITKKEFIKKLVESKSIFIGSVFRWNDEKCIKALENVDFVRSDSVRTVTEVHSQYIIFNDGSRLDFNQHGKKEYFTYDNENGIRFYIQRTTEFNDFDKKYEQNYMLYVLVEMALWKKISGITKDEAIENHRKMWRWLAKETEKRKRKVEKPAYFKKHGVESIPHELCYCCEYGRCQHYPFIPICESCPVEWPGGCCFRGDALYHQWSVATDYHKAAELARQIAELPEKEGV